MNKKNLIIGAVVLVAGALIYFKFFRKPKTPTEAQLEGALKGNWHPRQPIGQRNKPVDVGSPAPVNTTSANQK